MKLIDADALKDTLGISDKDIEFAEMLDEQPTVDAVPVIRCKDCKYWGADGYRYGCKYATDVMFENDYCSRAERKEA